MRDIFQHVVGHWYRHSYIHNFFAIFNIFDEVAYHPNSNQIFSGFKVRCSVDFEIAKHANVRTCQLTIDIHFADFRNSIKIQGNLFRF